MPGALKSIHTASISPQNERFSNDDLQTRIEDAVKNPRNLGEMKDADAIGTVGSADCGDMLRMWVKFKEEGGRKVIDRATFQTFGCQTAIAVASVATEMLAGKNRGGSEIDVGRRTGRAAGAVAAGKNSLRAISRRGVALGIVRRGSARQAGRKGRKGSDSAQSTQRGSDVGAEGQK